MGDVKLLAALGLFLGPYVLLVLMLGSVLGAVVGVGAAVRSGEGLASAAHSLRSVPRRRRRDHGRCRAGADRVVPRGVGPA